MDLSTVTALVLAAAVLGIIIWIVVGGRRGAKARAQSLQALGYEEVAGGDRALEDRIAALYPGHSRPSGLYRKKSIVGAADTKPHPYARAKFHEVVSWVSGWTRVARLPVRRSNAPGSP